MNRLRNSLRITLRSCFAWTSPNSALYKSIWHMHLSSLYARKVQSMDGWALSYCLWYTLSSSLLHFLPWFIWATWRYTLMLNGTVQYIHTIVSMYEYSLELRYSLELWYSGSTVCTHWTKHNIHASMLGK